MPHFTGATLPDPGPDALAHSRRLAEHIATTIADAGGWIPFARYMDLALYAPGRGYYVAGARKFGAEGDFVTAPELSPLFGAALARQFAAVLGQTGGEVLELGAGSGRLACDLLHSLADLDCLPARYHILEVSPDLRERQAARLAEAAPALHDRVVWLDALPETFSGVVIANEVLDALPVHRVVGQPDGLIERGVIRAGDGFAWSDRPLNGPNALSAAAAQLPPLAPGQVAELSLAGPALVHSLGAMLRQGLILLIDYGYPRAELYAGRPDGTLLAHYRHHALHDPFVLPGLCDLTAHVDFTAIADAGLAAGLDVLGFAEQGPFLMNCGLLSDLAALEPGSPAFLRQAAAVQKLVNPAEMGAVFKVIALARGLEPGLRGFMRGDLRHRL